MMVNISLFHHRLTAPFDMGLRVIYPVCMTGILAASIWFGVSSGQLVVLALTACIYILVMAREATTERRMLCKIDSALAELNEKNRWLRMTEATAHVGHWRMDFADDSLFWSDETFAIHGLPIGKVPSLEDAIALYHEDDRDLVVKAVETARLMGTPYSFAARLIRPDGGQRDIDIIAQIELGPDGTAAAMFGVCADRTDEVTLRDALTAACDEARAAVGAKAEFLAKMSHEIRTPMNGVIGFADILLTSDLSEQQRRHAELIAESGKALTLLLNDILDLSKIEAGELSIDDTNVDIHHLASRCLRLVEPQAREKGLHLDLTIAPDVPRYVMADPLRLRQILNNLLTNAVKFTDHGFVSLMVDADHDTMSYTVRDSGIGIRAERLEKVFEIFTQANNRIAAERGGTGLGLTISRQLATKMGGSISVTSQPTIGSSFVVRLPLKHGEPKELEVSAIGSVNVNPSQSGHKVLLAEDYDINQMLVAAMAEQCGMQLDIVENGSEAVREINAAAASHAPYQLVLMDLQMPIMGGIAATKALRAQGHTAESLPIIALTANAFPDDIAFCLKAGMQGHLAKPMSLDAFLVETRRWLPLQVEAA